MNLKISVPRFDKVYLHLEYLSIRTHIDGNNLNKTGRADSRANNVLVHRIDFSVLLVVNALDKMLF